MYTPPFTVFGTIGNVFPVGDQSGCQLFPGAQVILHWVAASDLLTHISDLPPRLKLYAMKRPSGDQVTPVSALRRKLAA